MEFKHAQNALGFLQHREVRKRNEWGKYLRVRLIQVYSLQLSNLCFSLTTHKTVLSYCHQVFQRTIGTLLGTTTYSNKDNQTFHFLPAVSNQVRKWEFLSFKQLLSHSRVFRMLPKWRIFFLFNAFNSYIDCICKKILPGAHITDWTHWSLPKPDPLFILHFIDHKQLKWKIIQLACKTSFFEILFLSLYFSNLSQKWKTVPSNESSWVHKKVTHYMYRFPKFFH